MKPTPENFKQMLVENNELKMKITSLKSENMLLLEKIQYLLNKIFGRSSERLNPDQLLLAFEELAELQTALEQTPSEVEACEDVVLPSKRGKRKPLDAKIPENLPVETIVIEPDEVLKNPELWVKIGEERTEQLDVVPTRFFKRVTIRPKYKKIKDRSVAPIIAPAPKRLIENSYASAGLLRHIILSKFCDHLPLYRQEQIFKQRFGVEISRKTMGGWMHLMANWLSLIYEALRSEIQASEYIQADETFIKYQDPKKDYCPNGYLWAYHSPGVGVLFEWHPSRSAGCLDSMLKGYKGLLQTDGYIGYTSWLNEAKQIAEKKEIIHAGCWAHARRKFVESPSTSTNKTIIKYIATLYRIETTLRENPKLDRYTIRQNKSVPILQKIKRILDAEKALPKSAYAKAIKYTLDRWDMLTRYLYHPTLEIDNNLIENSIRPTAIGKKNWLFFGSPHSGQDSAILYSLIETCRKLKLNPADYLEELFKALPNMEQNEIKNWTPARWSHNHKAHFTEHV